MNPDSRSLFARLLASWMALPLASRWAVIVWVSVAGGIFGRVLYSAVNSQTVVPIYLDAGWKWRSGVDLYDPTPGLDVYRYPPGIAALFAALTPLPGKAAALLWRTAGLVILLTGLARFRRDVAPELSATRAAWLFILAAVLTIPSLNNGQVNHVIAGCGLHGTAAMARGRWWSAALWFSISGWIKVYPLSVGGLAALTAPWRLGPRLLLVLAAGFALPFLLADPAYVAGQYRSFISHVTSDDRMHSILSRVPLDWTVLTRTWLDWIPPKESIPIVSLVSAVVFAVMVFVASRRGRLPLVLALTLGSVWMTVFGPATEMNTYSILAGIAAYLVVAPNSPPRWTTYAAGVAFALLLSSVLRCLFAKDWQYQVYGPQPFAALLLAVVAIVRECKKPRG